jgi:hypothetical protein
MHKNSYNPKVLNGNWCEERFTDRFDRKHDNSSNTFLSNPSYSKYVPTSKAIGNKSEYQKVSSPFYQLSSNALELQPKIG